MAMTKNMMTLHRWLGLVGGVFILIAGATAIGLNHGDQLKAFAEQRDPREGPYAHGVKATALDAADPKRLLVGTHHGLFESTDAGRSWHATALPVEGERVGTLVTDPTRAGRLWATVNGKHLLKSDDTGRHWKNATPDLGNNHIEALSLDAVGEPVIATEGGLLHGKAFIPRPEVPGVERAKRIQGLIAELHMGDVYGRYGVPVTDLIGASLILLVLSGYFLFIQREWKVRMARRKARLNVTVAPAAKQKAAV